MLFRLESVGPNCRRRYILGLTRTGVRPARAISALSVVRAGIRASTHAATLAEKATANNAAASGARGQAEIGIARFLEISKAMALNGDAPEVRHFDTAEWLGA